MYELIDNIQVDQIQAGVNHGPKTGTSTDTGMGPGGWSAGVPPFNVDAGPDADAMVHVHGFGISGTYLEPTAALLAPHYRTFVPDLPGMGRSIRPEGGLDLRAGQGADVLLRRRRR